MAYSKRIDRAAYQDLNPFIYLLDELSYWQGNPYLKPQLAHRVTLQYAHKSSTIITGSYNYTKDFTADITDTTNGNKIIMTVRNMGTQHHLALSLYQTASLKKWWNVTLNAMGYFIQNELQYTPVSNYIFSNKALRINLNQKFKLPSGINTEVAFTYNSKRLIGAAIYALPVSVLSIGLQKSFFKDKASISLLYSDIYKGSQQKSYQYLGAFKIDNYGYYESRQFKINISYKISSNAGKSPRERNSALEAENNV